MRISASSESEPIDLSNTKANGDESELRVVEQRRGISRCYRAEALSLYVPDAHSASIGKLT